jgi:hypothetical protein
MSVLTDLRNRGVKDIFFVACERLRAYPRWSATLGFA